MQKEDPPSLWIVCQKAVERDEHDNYYVYSSEYSFLHAKEKMIFSSKEEARQSAIAMTREMLGHIQSHGQPMMSSLHSVWVSTGDHLVRCLQLICREITGLYPPEDRSPSDTEEDEIQYIVNNYDDIVSAMESIFIFKTADVGPLTDVFSENLYHRYIDVLEIPAHFIDQKVVQAIMCLREGDSLEARKHQLETDIAILTERKRWMEGLF